MSLSYRLFSICEASTHSILATACAFSLVGCTSSLLSKRTDEQAWIEYQAEKQNEKQHERKPTSVPASTGLDPTVEDAVSQIDLRKILLTCRGAAEKDCFNLTLKRTFDLALGEQVVHPYRNEFILNHSYEKTVADVLAFHRLLLSGMDFRADERIRVLQRQCKGEPEAQLSCLKSNWQTDAQALLAETTQRLGLVISSAETKAWIIERQIIPEYEKTSRALTIHEEVKP